MKLINKIFFGSAAIALAGSFTACKEEATLGGSDAVYIEIAQTDVTMLVGDTLKISARVSNVSGHDINTPITWSVDNPEVVKLVEVTDTIVKKHKSRSRADEGDGGEPTTPGEGDGEGETPVDPGKPDTPQQMDTTFVTYPVLIAQAGAQGKTTNLRATIETGQFAMTTITVGRNALSGSITPAQDELTAYILQKMDTAWFNVNPIALVDDYDVSYEFNIIEAATQSANPDENVFTHPEDDICIDRKGGRVGIVYTGPRMAGKAECVLTIGNDTESETASIPVYIFPQITGGLTYTNGEGVRTRPGYGPMTPSNQKPMLISESMDVNSEMLVEVCLGVADGYQEQIDNAKAAQTAGYFKWSVEGNAVVTVEQGFDDEYEGGVVTYLKVRSGITPGTARVTYTMPGMTYDRAENNTEQIFICDITVEDYAVAHPVEYIVVNMPGQTDKNISELTVKMGEPLSLDVYTYPDASFTYHIPVVTSSDESVVTVVPRGGGDGYSRRFELKNPGEATLHITSLDKEKDVLVTVLDKVSQIRWAASSASSVPVGGTAELTANVLMASGQPITGDVTFEVSDPSIATVALKPGTNNVAEITGKQAGSVQVTASYDDVTSEPFTVTVTSIEDIDLPANANAEARCKTNKDLTLRLHLYETSTGSGSTDRIRIDFPAITSNYWNKQHTGSNAAVTFRGADYTANYEITLVSNGDGTCTINGYVELPNGQKIKFTNLTVKQASNLK